MKKNCGLSGIHANQIQDTHFHSSWSMARIVPFNIHGLINEWLNVKHGPRQIESTGSNAHSLWDGDRL